MLCMHVKTHYILLKYRSPASAMIILLVYMTVTTAIAG